MSDDDRHVTSLMAQYTLAPGDLTALRPGEAGEYGFLLTHATQTAYRRLLAAAESEGRVLRKPVMVKVVVEAYTDPKDD